MTLREVRTQTMRQPPSMSQLGLPLGLAHRQEMLTAVSHISRRNDFISRFDRAIRRRLTLVCAPAGTGKSAACREWAAARARTRQIVWLTMKAEEDQAWFWAEICSRLERTAVATAAIINALEDGPPSGFSIRLVVTARLFAEPVVIVVDNADIIDDRQVLKGLDLVARYAPPSLRLVLCARTPPALDLSRLRSAGDLAEIDATGLAPGQQNSDRSNLQRVTGPG
jgi:LuxR family transcriptional regulator, maltose regulon positive regulatory protein